LRAANARFDVADEQFTAITSIRELSDGRVLVADRRENRLAVVDFARNRSSPVGRTGSGPGEYRLVGWVFPLSSDSSLLSDAGTRRWLLLAATEIVETIPAEQALNQLAGLSGTDQFGRVLGVVGISQSTMLLRIREYADSLGVVLGSRSGNKVDTIARIRGRGSAGRCMTVRRGEGRQRPVSSACNPIATEDLTLLFWDGWVAVATVDPYRVSWRDAEGRWIRGPTLPYEAVPLDERDKCAVLGGPPRLGLAGPCATTGYDWPAAMPPFLSINVGASAPFAPTALATPDGNLLIRRAPTVRFNGTRYDLVNRRGVLIGRLTLPGNEAVVGFGLKSVYVVDTTELGLQRLRRHPWL
jgi:hypothetical protein